VTRLLAILASFLACCALIVGAVVAGVGPHALARGAEMYQYREFFDRLFGKVPGIPPRENPRLVVFLGDSTIMAPRRPSYPQLLRRPLAERQADIRVIAGGAFDPYVFYYLAGRVIEDLDPDVVVIVAHLTAFLPKGANRAFTYNDLSSYLLPSLLPRTFLLPIAERQLSPARLVLAQALEFEAGERLFFAAEGARSLYRDAPFWDVLGPPKPPAVFNPAFPDVLRDYDAAVTRSQATVRMLEATVRVVAEAGRPAIVVATPIPWEALEKRPWFAAAALERRYAVLRAVVEDAGGIFVDLHRFLAQAEFVDYGGHFNEMGAQRMANAVWPHVRDALQRTQHRAASWTPGGPER
jgi:hypothetical protein